MSASPLSFAVGGTSDASGACTLKIQFGSYAPPQSWAKVNAILDLTGSAQAQIVADSIVLDQAGGPQPQLGPAVFMANQNVTIVVTGATPNTVVVAHVSGAWSTNLNELDGIATLSGGTIGAQQIVGTPFLNNESHSIVANGSYTSSIFPMLGYSAVQIQSIVTLGSLTSMPTVTLQWLDTNNAVIYQSNWQAQKIIDTVAAWGQNMQIVVQNNDAAHTCNIALTVVPVTTTPFPKAAALTYKATALNELVGIHNQAVTVGQTVYAYTAAGLGWSGPATLYVSPGAPGFLIDPWPDYAFSLSCAQSWSGSQPFGPITAIGPVKTLVEYNRLCPTVVEAIDLIDQPLLLTFTNNSTTTTATPEISVTAGYR